MNKCLYFLILPLVISLFTNPTNSKLKQKLTFIVNRKYPALPQKFALPAWVILGKRALSYTNQFRRQNGLRALLWNHRMAVIGRAHSINMGTGRVPFSHAGFERRVSRFGFPVRRAGENLFFGNIPGDIARTAVNAWINSPGHRRNLLGLYNLCGIGVYKNAQGFYYFTQEFALK